MEGVVRQIWKADAATEICFVYTMHEGMTNDLAAGRFPRSASAMEHIADHYGIPSIHLAMEAARRIRVGEWIFKSPKPDVPADPDRGFPARKAFAPDGCHPFAETGHRLYTEALARAFERMENLGQPGAHALPEPFTPDNHENAMMILLSRDFLIGSWWKLDRTTNALARNFARQLPVLWQATEAGDSLRFSFHGRWAALYDLLGPDGGCKVQANAGPGQKSR
ncbi:MAG TPA: SGNH/GDSL hydrolase family protein, partial [Candidatus Paceibacterota bacterium]|nr:SGNH/GDSL hydrolase family protein [Candidatus Paceibacterota bacterium]